VTAADDVDHLIERYQLALDEFMKGNPGPVQELFSHREDVSLANPYGPLFADGSGLRRSRSTPRRCAETAGPPASRSWRST
jgi:hypothetical protein